MKLKAAIISILMIFVALPLAGADTGINLSKGQSVYVPAYSHIYAGIKAKPYPLTITLSIRNINQKTPIRINRVKFREAQGELVQDFIKSPVSLKGFSSVRYLIPSRKSEGRKGGSGGHFIVEWDSEIVCNPPVIEAIMIGTQSQQGISFTSRGLPMDMKK